MKPDTCVSIVYAAIASITAKSAYGMEEINADVNASFLSKKMTGVRRSAAILSDMLFGSKAERAPKRFQLAVVGLGRTGSTSFHSALKELGYTPVHDDEAMEVADLLDAMTKDGASYGAIAAAFGRRGFDAAFLTTHRFVEWVASAPDVKVVLTVRDKKKWARSWLTVAPAAFLCEQRPFRWIESMRTLAAYNREVMLNVPTGGRPELYQDLPTLEAGYDAWVDFVRKTVPKERLLEFDVRQGWTPLCEFLGKDEPPKEKPFPHINDGKVVDATVKALVLITWIWPILFALPLFIIWSCVASNRYRKQVADTSKKDS